MAQKSISLHLSAQADKNSLPLYSSAQADEHDKVDGGRSPRRILLEFVFGNAVFLHERFELLFTQTLAQLLTNLPGLRFPETTSTRTR